MSALALQPDLSQAERFLTLLDETAESFTFQTFTDTPSGTAKPDPDPLAKIKHGTLSQHASWLTSMNCKGAGIFVAVNATDGRGRGRDNITRIRALWQEDDTGDTPALPTDPHIVVESSPGRFHRYLLVDDLPMVEFEPAQHRMVLDYGSDPRAQDRARVLRLPGFWHVKDKANPHLVTITQESGTRPIPWAKLRTILPPAERQAHTPKDSEARVHVTPGQVADLRSALNSISADDYQTWIAMGHALVELGNTGRGLWLDWSQTSAKWQPQDAGKWATFSGERTSYQAVFAEAKRRGWVNPKARDADVPPMPPANYEQDEHEPILVSLDNLGSIQPKPPAYLINPIIPRGHLTLLGGHGEAGKSQLKLTLGCHVAVGKPWAGLEVARGKVVVVSMEDPADIFLYRLKKIVREYAIDPVKLAANMTMIDASESGPLATEINDFGNKRLRFTPFAEKIRLLAQGADLLIIDGASDAYAADANSLVMVKQFLKTIISWVRGHGGAVLLLAHIDKSGARNGTAGNSYLGSVSWHNTPRSRLALVKDERVADTVHLKHEKLNLAKKLPEPITLQWNDDGVMVPVTTEVSAMVAKWAESTHDEDVYAAIKAALAAGVTIPTALTGAHTAWHMLLPFPELPTNLKTSGRGKKTVDAAMIRLQRAGRIRKETIKVNYKPRDRWVLADGTPQDEDA